MLAEHNIREHYRLGLAARVYMHFLSDPIQKTWKLSQLKKTAMENPRVWGTIIVR